jgi:hypothetical protein
MKLHHRTCLKQRHRSLLPLVEWFTLVPPVNIRTFGPAEVTCHPVSGPTFIAPALVWTADCLAHGLNPKRGPRALHRFL